MKLTLLQARAHLNGLQKLAVSENRFLSCVHTYLRDAEWSVHHAVPASEFKDHVSVRELLELEQQTTKQIEGFLAGLF